MNTNTQASFGCINIEKGTFHEGRVVDGEMYYKGQGVPTDISNFKPKEQVNPSDKIIHHEGFVSGPRWAGMRRYLTELSYSCDVGLTLDEDRGWINTTFYWKLKGTRKNIQTFINQVKHDIENY